MANKEFERQLLAKRKSQWRRVTARLRAIKNKLEKRLRPPIPETRNLWGTFDPQRRKDFDEFLKIYKVFRDYLEHEDDLLNHRTGWLITVQSVLFATFGFSIQKYFDAMIQGVNRSINTDMYTKYLFVLYALVGVGLVSSVGASFGISAARRAQREIKTLWDERHRGDQLAYGIPYIAGGGNKTADQMGSKFAEYLPLFFVLLWLAIGGWLAVGSVDVRLSVNGGSPASEHTEIKQMIRHLQAIAPGSDVDALTREVAAIRQLLERGSITPQPPSAPFAPGREIIVPGTTTFRWDGTQLLWLSVLAIGGGLSLIGGGLLLYSGRGAGAKATALVAAGAMSLGGGVYLIKDTKIDSVFRFGDVTLRWMVREEIQNIGSVGPENIGSIVNFKLGSSNEVENFDDDAEVQRISERWIKERKAGKNGVLLFVGSTDRLPLNQTTHERFEANVGLARARAEEIKERVIEQTRTSAPDLIPSPQQMLILVTGPSKTPPLAAAGVPASNNGGVPDDRRVDVWAFWSSAHSGSQ